MTELRSGGALHDRSELLRAADRGRTSTSTNHAPRRGVQPNTRQPARKNNRRDKYSPFACSCVHRWRHIFMFHRLSKLVLLTRHQGRKVTPAVSHQRGLPTRPMFLRPGPQVAVEMLAYRRQTDYQANLLEDHQPAKRSQRFASALSCSRFAMRNARADSANSANSRVSHSETATGALAVTRSKRSASAPRLHRKLPAIAIGIMKPEPHILRARRLRSDLVSGIFEFYFFLLQVSERLPQRRHVR